MMRINATLKAALAGPSIEGCCRSVEISPRIGWQPGDLESLVSLGHAEEILRADLHLPRSLVDASASYRSFQALLLVPVVFVMSGGDLQFEGWLHEPTRWRERFDVDGRSLGAVLPLEIRGMRH